MPKHLPLVTRRELMSWAGAAGAASAVGTGCSSASSPTPTPSGPAASPGYFTPDERAVLEALADAVLPPDDAPGGAALGSVSYIENLLTAFEKDSPPIFAGGPYSGRHPFQDGKGGASSRSPSDDFADFLPLDRVAERAWRLRIYGSKGVSGGAPNEAVTGPVVGLREVVATAISQAKSAVPAHASVGSLTAAEKGVLLDNLDRSTQDAIIEIILEGAFAAPEYGGNAGLAGWKMTYFDGDVLPLGYSLWDDATQSYRERADAPVSTPNPGPDPMPLDASTEKILATAFTLLGGKVFK